MTAEQDRWGLHQREHDHDEKALDAALDSEKRRLEAHREAHEAAHAAHEKLHEASEQMHVVQHDGESKAVLAATTAMDRRLDGMNEFRDQLRDQAATFVRRETMEAEVKTLNAAQQTDAKSNADAITILRDWTTKADGTLTALTTTGAEHKTAIAGLQKDVRDLTDTLNRAAGSLSTLRSIALFMGLPGAVALVLTILRMFGGETP